MLHRHKINKTSNQSIHKSTQQPSGKSIRAQRRALHRKISQLKTNPVKDVLVDELIRNQKAAFASKKFYQRHKQEILAQQKQFAITHKKEIAELRRKNKQTSKMLKEFQTELEADFFSEQKNNPEISSVEKYDKIRAAYFENARLGTASLYINKNKPTRPLPPFNQNVAAPNDSSDLTTPLSELTTTPQPDESIIKKSDSFPFFSYVIWKEPTKDDKEPIIKDRPLITLE